jgi:hypothetical protein
VVAFFAHRYSRQGLGSLFLTCAFPLHFWALLMAFRDISWVAERTNLWDAIGVLAYGVVFALVESIVIFLVLALLGLFTPPQWDSDRRIAFLGLLILLTALWGMISQLLFIWNVFLPAQAVHFLRSSNHPYRILYAACLAVVVFTIGLPVYFFIRSKKSVPFMQDLMERLSLLTLLYLFLDLLGLLIIIVRNVN